MQDRPAVAPLHTEALVRRLAQHPHLQTRREALLDVIDNAAGDIVKADEAEQRFLEELRQMGQEAMQAWAKRKQAKVEAAAAARSDLTRKEKKVSTGTAASEPSP